MTNYEHIFESAMSAIKSGKSFKEFKETNIVQYNCHDIFRYFDKKHRIEAVDKTLMGIWCIADYVSAYYTEKE